MLAIAAALILIGTVSKNWVSAGRGSKDVHAGPLGVEACMGGGLCVDVPTRGIDGDIEAIMLLAVISGFASAAAAGVFGGMAFSGKTDRIPIAPRLAQAAFGLAAFSMTFFVIRMMSEGGELSWAGFPAIGGVVLAGIGLKKLTPFLAARPALPSGAQAQPPGQPMANASQPMHPYASQSQAMHPYANQSQPMPPQMPPPQMQPPQVHNCPRCGAQLQFVAQYQRWFCPHEQQYL